MQDAISSGADINEGSGTKEGSALHAASKRGHLACLQLLLEREADPDATDEEVSGGHTEICVCCQCMRDCVGGWGRGSVCVPARARIRAGAKAQRHEVKESWVD